MRRLVTLVLIVWVAGCGDDKSGGGPDARERPDADEGQLDIDATVIGGDIDAAVPRVDAAPGAGDAAPSADARATDAGAAQACSAANATAIQTTSATYLAQTFAGAQDRFDFSNMCSNAPDSAERAYSFTVAQNIEWYAETRCGWDCELVLTKNGCANENVVTCATTSGDEILGGTLTPGAYTLFVEGDKPDDPADYDLMINFNHTAGQATCAATVVNATDMANCEDTILADPRFALHLNDQSTSPADKDDFFVAVSGCNKDQAHVGGAPDKVYSFTLPAAHDVEVELDPDFDGVVYITGSPCGAQSAVKACSDSLVGSNETVTANLGAGTWYVVVDGFGEETFTENSWGAFNLSIYVYDPVCDE